MRSKTAYLVVMMVMMGCFAVVRLNPTGLLLHPGNIAVTAALLIGAVAVALKRPLSLGVGLAASAITAISGVLCAKGVSGFVMPGYPLLWSVIGLYIAFRLVIDHQQTLRQQTDRRAKANLAARNTGDENDPA